MQQTLTNSKKIPGGPKGSPLVGVMFEFPRDRRAFLTNVAAQYGDVARFSIANINFYEVVHPDGVRHVLQGNQSNYERGKMFDPIRNLVGNGLLLSDGSFWQRQRSLMEPAYHAQHISAFAESYTRGASQLVQRWQANASEGLAFDAAQDLFDLCLSLATETVFGSLGTTDSVTIGRSVNSLLENISFHFETPFYPSISMPTPRNRHLVRELQAFDEILARAMQARHGTDQTGATASGADLLSMFMAARANGTNTGMSAAELRSEILTVFSTAPQPTSIALAWTFYFLAQHPVFQAKLSAELSQVLNGRLPTLADLPRLSYTRMLLQESMRLFPPAWLVNRSAIGEDEIAGFAIPAGAVIMLSPYLTHRHVDFWPDPEKFDPERFSPEASAKRPPFSYFPFGLGPHQCIGMDLAMLQAQLILATLAQRFRLELVPGNRVDVLSGLMLRPNQLPVKALPVS